MAKEIVTMSVQKALEKVKTLTDKKNKIRTRGMSFAAIILDQAQTDENGVDKEKVLSKIQSNFDSTIAVLENLDALKAAISDSNAKTMVKIAGREMSVASAISFHQNVDARIQAYQFVLDSILDLENKLENWNQRNLSPEAISRYVQNVLGDSKKDDDLISSVTERYRKEHARSVYDPLNLKEKAQATIDALLEFKDDVHSILVASNVNTMIEVELHPISK